MSFAHRHLLGIEQLSQDDIATLLDLADTYADLNRQPYKHSDALKGLTQINMFFENSTRTQASFEIAGKRLGADVMNMAMQASSIKKGETLIDTAMTLNAMHPDLLVVRHPQSGAVDLLAAGNDYPAMPYLMPVTGVMNIRPRPCLTLLPFAGPKVGCTVCPSRSAAISPTAGWHGPISCFWARWKTVSD